VHRFKKIILFVCVCVCVCVCLNSLSYFFLDPFQPMTPLLFPFLTEEADAARPLLPPIAHLREDLLPRVKDSAWFLLSSTCSSSTPGNASSSPSRLSSWNHSFAARVSALPGECRCVRSPGRSPPFLNLLSYPTLSFFNPKAVASAEGEKESAWAGEGAQAGRDKEDTAEVLCEGAGCGCKDAGDDAFSLVVNSS
jgi:hypothetical protein